MTPWIVTEYVFLTHDKVDHSITLQPELAESEGTYEEARLIFAMELDPDLYRFEVVISSNIKECELASIGFTTK